MTEETGRKPIGEVTSRLLFDKALQAALSAIEIYNKPDFRYREELFCILMCNAWELALKAKAMLDSRENFGAIVATRNEKNELTSEVSTVAKLARSGNVLTVSLGYL